VARFWDASALIPLLVHEPTTVHLLALLRSDERIVAWWGTRVECVSALARRVREDGLDPDGETQARAVLTLLATNWSEIQATDRVRSLAERTLAVHPLRAADALQLASALVWSDGAPAQRAFVCLDDRLREAARKEGFTVQPPH
jgi:predicted nucleic acid-binding protein